MVKYIACGNYNNAYKMFCLVYFIPHSRTVKLQDSDVGSVGLIWRHGDNYVLKFTETA